MRNASDRYAYVVGYNETLLQHDGKVSRQDNGTMWSPMSSGVTAPVYVSWGSSGKDMYAAVEDSSTLLHYDGSAWSAKNIGSNFTVSGVYGTSTTDVFAAGAVRTILHYDGKAWSSMKSSTMQYLLSMWASLANGVFAVGEGGTILHYDGNQWSATDSGTHDRLSPVWGSSGSDVFVVGEKGTICITTAAPGRRRLATRTALRGAFAARGARRLSPSVMRARSCTMMAARRRRWPSARPRVCGAVSRSVLPGPECGTIQAGLAFEPGGLFGAMKLVTADSDQCQEVVRDQARAILDRRDFQQRRLQ